MAVGARLFGFVIEPFDHVVILSFSTREILLLCIGRVLPSSDATQFRKSTQIKIKHERVLTVR